MAEEQQNTPDKMKVAELRAALQERGLDTKGTKPVLVARLQEAFDAENAQEADGENAAEPKSDAEPAAEAPETNEDKDEEPAKEDKMEVDAEVKEGKEEETKTDEKEDAKGVKRKLGEDAPFEVKENEPEIAESLVCLDWYNSDLNLRITEDLMSGIPFSRDGWGYCYAGARSTFGFNKGKVWFEVKYLENMDVKVEKESSTFDLRVGWSSNSSNLMLGEDAQSWCYSSAEGKMAHNKTFEEYGEKFEKDDVIGAYLDFDGDEVSMTFTKNGEDQGDAFQISKDELGDVALFPHVMARNVKFEVNFGTDKEGENVADWKEKLEGSHSKAGQVAEEDRVRGEPRIADRAECEMVMMVGLPASGKTTWVEKHVAEHPDKHYNVISTTSMINKMTINGEPRKKHHKGKWEQVVQKATRSLQEMLRAASQRRRNVIIDQTNVYPNAQKRKARPFEGFQRQCVVVVPTDEEYKARCKAQEEAGCKDIPDEAIMEMKANFTLPDDESDAVVKTFVDITFVEQDREAAAAVVELYNKVAKEKGYGKKHEERKAKKFRGNNTRGSFRGSRGTFAPRGMRGNPRGSPFARARGASIRGTMRPMRGGQGPWMARGRGGPSMGPRGGRPGNMGPSPWNQGGNMGGGMGPQGWGPWNQGGGMGGPGMGNNMGGGMGNMDDMMSKMMSNMGGMSMGSSDMKSMMSSSSSFSSSSSSSMMSSSNMLGGGMSMPPMRGMEMPGLSFEEMSSMPPTASTIGEKPEYTVTSPPMSPPPPAEMNHKVEQTEDYIPPTASQTAEATVLLKVKEGNEYKLALNMQQYTPEDITIKLNGNELTVEATNGGESFKQKHVVPDNIDLDAMSSSFSSDGVLVIKAPKK